jgi:transcriptional regulator with XRE-family HTH domain
VIGRSRGSVLLARVGERQEDVARACGCSRSAVGHWMTGHSRPAGDFRQRLRDQYDIPVEAWAEDAAPLVEC